MSAWLGQQDGGGGGAVVECVIRRETEKGISLNRAEELGPIAQNFFGRKMTIFSCDQKIRKKIRQIFRKVAQKDAESKKAKISTTKLNLKAHNIYK
jgi:hypothetical protein